MTFWPILVMLGISLAMNAVAVYRALTRQHRIASAKAAERRRWLIRRGWTPMCFHGIETLIPPPPPPRVQ